MPKACVKMKMKQGMSRKSAIKACYPLVKKVSKGETTGKRLAKKAIDVLKKTSLTYQAAKAVKRHRKLKEIQKSKPPKMEIRKSASPMEKQRRRKKAKSMRVGTPRALKPSTKKKQKGIRRAGRLGRDY